MYPKLPSRKFDVCSHPEHGGRSVAPAGGVGRPPPRLDIRGGVPPPYWCCHLTVEVGCVVGLQAMPIELRGGLVGEADCVSDPIVLWTLRAVT